MSLLEQDPRASEVAQDKLKAFGTFAIPLVLPEMVEPQVVQLNADEYLRYRYIGTKPLSDYAEGEDPFVGMLVRVLANDFIDNNLKEAFQRLFFRVHPALFNPESNARLQINLLNRSLRALMGVMPFDTMANRVTLSDDVTELGDWVTIYKLHILPCFVQYEKRLKGIQEPEVEAEAEEQTEAVEEVQEAKPE